MSTGKLLLLLSFCIAMLVVSVGCAAVAWQLMHQKAPADPREPIQVAGDGSPGVRVHRSSRNDLLMSLAKEHAESMASRERQDHDGFIARAATVAKELKLSAAEICAESWASQSSDSEASLWMEAFRSWKRSPKHWIVAGRRHAAYGYAMSKGSDGIWYFCIIAGN